MKVNALEFYRSQKVPQIMEDKINKILSEGQFKFATQNESPQTGKVILTVFTDGASATIKAKVFRETSASKTDKAIESFLNTSKLKMKLSTQSFVGNTITTVLFYE